MGREVRGSTSVLESVFGQMDEISWGNGTWGDATAIELSWPRPCGYQRYGVGGVSRGRGEGQAGWEGWSGAIE